LQRVELSDLRCLYTMRPIDGQELQEHQATLGAVDLYLDTGQPDRAVEVAASIAGDLVRAGRWAALADLRQHLENRPQPIEMPTVSSPLQPVERSGVLTVHLLGELRVALTDLAVEAWASGRGRAIFEYLITHRHSRVPRDRLMNVFWPESSPSAARNSLNVAIHALRQSLRSVASDRPVVMHRDGGYEIDPALHVWVDVEAFEDHIHAAQRHAEQNQINVAVAEYEAAIHLYQGDFLADDPYEDWALVTREHLRLAYLGALDQLSQLHFNEGRYSTCVALCLQLLVHDECREDAHYRLMCCYCRLHQPQLAVRQYQTCATVLRRELGFEPSAATRKLLLQIQAQRES
jgi:DNA-binding SARP family transcriptional activator